MFRAIISPILRSTDCVYSLWYNVPTMQSSGSIVDTLYHKLQTQSVLLRMGEIIARNMLS